MIHPRLILYTFLITATWEGMFYITVQGFNIRPYQLFLLMGLVLAILRRSFPFDSITMLLALYVLAGIPGLRNSIALSDSIRTIFFSAVMVLIALIVRVFLRSSYETLEQGLWFWVLVVGNIVNAFGLLQFITWLGGSPISPHFVPELSPLYRPYSVFIEPNFYGNFLASQLVMLLILALSPGARRYLPAIAPSIGVSALLLALNQSRGPWIAAFLSLSLFVAIRYLRRQVIPMRLALMTGLIVSGSIVFLALAFLTSPTLAEKFVERIRDAIYPFNEGTAQHRMRDIQASLKLFQEHPWIGHSPGTWGYYIGIVGRDARTPPRNLVVAWLFEKGILGAFTGLLLTFALVKRLVDALLHAEPHRRLLIWAPFAGWLTIFITLQFTVLEISPFYWAILGMFLAATDLSLKALQKPLVSSSPISSQV